MAGDHGTPQEFYPLHILPPPITRGDKIYIPDEDPSVWRVSSVGSCGEGGSRGSADRDGDKIYKRGDVLGVGGVALWA